MRWRNRIAALGLCGLYGSLLASCTVAYLGDDYGEIGNSGAGSGGSTGETCSGTCEPSTMGAFRNIDFVLLTIVPEGEDLPPCPYDIAPTKALDGYADVVAPPAECGPCTCQPSTGSCTLPTTITASTAACNLPGMAVAFNAPSPWGGACTTQDAIAADLNCPGPNCIQSLTIQPPVVTDLPCAVGSPPTTTLEKARWVHQVRTCTAAMLPVPCGDLEHFCAPSAALASQEVGAPFLECVQTRGNADCPDAWPEKHAIYRSKAFVETRACGGCSCGPPVGSKCSTTISVYTDDCCGCKPGTFVVGLNVDSTKSSCGDVLSGTALGSKTATTPVYEPGSCAPSEPVASGDVAGDDDPDTDNRYTACCRGAPH